MNLLKLISRFAIVVAVVMASILSCDKLPENGDLDGQWQLMQITKNDSIEDTKSQRIYYSFQLKLMEIRQTTTGRRYLTRFSNTGDSLIIYDYRIYQIDTLAMFGELTTLGLPGNSSRFAIEKLTKDKLVLSSDSTELKFRKY